MARQYSIDDLPDGDYARYRKLFSPRAIRIDGPFECVTSEGNVAACDDGWLAVDSRGFPYPINAEEFDKTYVLSHADETVDAR